MKQGLFITLRRVNEVHWLMSKDLLSFQKNGSKKFCSRHIVQASDESKNDLERPERVRTTRRKEKIASAMFRNFPDL